MGQFLLIAFATFVSEDLTCIATGALIASGMTALQAASTAADQDRLTNELDAWRNLLVDAAVTTATVH